MENELPSHLSLFCNFHANYFNNFEFCIPGWTKYETSQQTQIIDRCGFCRFLTGRGFLVELENNLKTIMSR